MVTTKWIARYKIPLVRDFRMLLNLCISVVTQRPSLVIV